MLGCQCKIPAQEILLLTGRYRNLYLQQLFKGDAYQSGYTGSWNKDALACRTIEPGRKNFRFNQVRASQSYKISAECRTGNILTCDRGTEGLGTKSKDNITRQDSVAL